MCNGTWRVFPECMFCWGLLSAGKGPGRMVWVQWAHGSHGGHWVHWEMGPLGLWAHMAYMAHMDDVGPLAPFVFFYHNCCFWYNFVFPELGLPRRVQTVLTQYSTYLKRLTICCVSEGSPGIGMTVGSFETVRVQIQVFHDIIHCVIIQFQRNNSIIHTNGKRYACKHH